MRRALAALAVVAVGVAACAGTTGDELITFPAYARGAQGASEPFESNGYEIQLTVARMFIGAVYINESPAGSTFDQPVCISSGIYAAQVPAGVDVDLLSTAPQPFAVQGNGTADLGQTWEMWLTTGDVNNPDNSAAGQPNIVDLQGTARRLSDGASFAWGATVNINQSNRGLPANDPSQPGLNPICKERIVEAGGIDVQLFSGGQLTVTVDPRGWFNVPIDFATLPAVASDACELDQASDYGDADYCIPDTSFGSGLGATQGATLFTAIQTGGTAAYQLSFDKAP